MKELLVSLDNVSRHYRHGQVETAALNNVSCQITANARVAVVGPSGSGKSTLLHLIAGLDLDDGSLWIDSPVAVSRETLDQIQTIGPVSCGAYPASCLEAGAMAHTVSRSPALETSEGSGQIGLPRFCRTLTGRPANSVGRRFRTTGVQRKRRH